jgi:hypothetical protein
LAAAARGLSVQASPPLHRLFRHGRRTEGQWRKTPATSELIDWVGILLRRSIDAAQLDEKLKLVELPEWPMLFKHQQDLNLAQKGSLG